MPDLTLTHPEPHRFTLDVAGPVPGVGALFLGALRALADDYGALALLEAKPGEDGAERIVIHLLDLTFASGRSFSLGASPT